MLKARDLKRDLPCLPSKIYGVDFSGAKKAGSKIWIASALIVRDVLKIEDCFQAKDLPGSAIERDPCLQALCLFISSQKTCALGLDFPFSLPSKLVEANKWEEFVLSFRTRYPDPEEFRGSCLVAADNRELRRDTDKLSHTPFSPYNLRLYRQTYYGIRNVLVPLVRDQLVYVMPMQSTLPGKPWLFEVCPASTLKSINLYLLPYKRADKESRLNRARIIKGVVETGAILIDSSALRSKIIDDRNGDALDSVIAAFATFRALRNLARSSVPETDPYKLEGYVYV